MALPSKRSGPGPVPPEVRPAPIGATKTGSTVVVACKLPNGIYIDAMIPDQEDENVIGGGVRVRKFFRRDVSSRVHILGNARPKGGSYRSRIVHGYALTQNVSKDIWASWLEANKDQPMVRNNLIFAEATVDAAADRARRSGKVRTGLEPLNPNLEKEPRAPHAIDPELGSIKMDDERMKRSDFEEEIDEEEMA